MLKFVDTKVVFQEIPDEVTLAINISNCPNNCEGCHSAYLADDIGTELSDSIVIRLIEDNKGISCIAFMGGDIDPIEIIFKAQIIKTEYPNIKVAWYSGKDQVDNNILINRKFFDYIKIGPYIPNRGPLNNTNTNQRMYKIDHEFYHNFVDITNKFWKHED